MNRQYQFKALCLHSRLDLWLVCLSFGLGLIAILLLSYLIAKHTSVALLLQVLPQGRLVQNVAMLFLIVVPLSVIIYYLIRPWLPYQMMQVSFTPDAIVITHKNNRNMIAKQDVVKTKITIDKQGNYNRIAIYLNRRFYQIYQLPNDKTKQPFIAFMTEYFHYFDLNNKPCQTTNEMSFTVYQYQHH